LGLGKSGRAAVHLLLKAGATSILANDSKDQDLLEQDMKEFISCSQVELFGGSHPESLLEGVSLIIKSPGIKPGLPLLQKAVELGIPVFSEIELAFHFSPVPILGITGTNGKTTTTSLIGEIFSRQFPAVYVAGNIGFPLCEAVEQAREGDIIVAELSSFQLDDIHNFKVHDCCRFKSYSGPSGLPWLFGKLYAEAKRKIL
jgi:UDP-N-acetylmuramoylalanine--D-glutamate ligase